MTEFPHLHFSLRKNNIVIDPFTGLPTGDCKVKGRQMWDSPLFYEPVKIFATGFADKSMDVEPILDDASSPTTLATNSDGLLFWAIIYGVKAGDTISLKVHGPRAGLFVDFSETLEKNKIRYFRGIGRKHGAQPFEAGQYRGEIVVKRGTLQRKAVNFVTLK